jgi:drug/metabolite transporter (DMT)-like permease
MSIRTTGGVSRSFIHLHIAILLAGLTGVLGRLITLNEGLLVWYRMLFSTVGLLLLAFMGKGIPRVPRSGILRLVGAGTVIALHWVAFYGSIKYSNVSIGLVCFSAIGFFTAVLGPLITRQPFDWVDCLLGGVVMLGIWLIFSFDGSHGTGILLGVLSALLGALFTILNKSMVTAYGSEAVTFYELGGGWMVLTLLLPFYIAAFPSGHMLPTLTDFLWLLVLSMLCTVLAFRLSVGALRDISPFTVNLSYNLEPVYGILLAFLIYREDRHLDAGFAWGFAVILLSVAFQSLRVWLKGKAVRAEARP